MNFTDNIINTGKNNQTLNRSLAFLGGVTIGSVAALLFAPKKGSDSRKQLMERLNGVTARLGTGNTQKATMAASPSKTMDHGYTTANAVKTKQNKEDANATKAQSMVSHLKHTKKDNSADYVD